MRNRSHDDSLDDSVDDSLDDSADDATDTVPCPRCGGAVYEAADRCPHCGNFVTLDGPRLGRVPGWIVAGAIAGLLAVLSWYLWF